MGELIWDDYLEHSALTQISSVMALSYAPSGHPLCHLIDIYFSHVIQCFCLTYSALH